MTRDKTEFVTTLNFIIVHKVKQKHGRKITLYLLRQDDGSGSSQEHEYS